MARLGQVTGYRYLREITLSSIHQLRVALLEPNQPEAAYHQLSRTMWLCSNELCHCQDQSRQMQAIGANLPGFAETDDEALAMEPKICLDWRPFSGRLCALPSDELLIERPLALTTHFAQLRLSKGNFMQLSTRHQRGKCPLQTGYGTNTSFRIVRTSKEHVQRN